MFHSSSLRSRSALLGGVLLAASPALAADPYSLTILHNNDGESRLTSYTDPLTQYGGVARFATLLDTTRTFYQGQGHGVLSIYAGDTFLAGAQFQASLDSGAPGSRTFYDALAISHMGYDASILGNHEFDFGPSVLAEFISDAQATTPTTYLSANLDFSAEADLQAHVTAGRIAPSKVVSVATSAGTKKVGIIGVTTETLAFVSSPGNVAVNPAVAAINAQINHLKNVEMVDHIVLGSHLQGIVADNDLVSSLDGGIDLIIAGGGDQILRNPAAVSPGTVYAGAPASIVDTTGAGPGQTANGLIPGDAVANISPLTNNYPVNSTVTDGDGNTIPIVTTGGSYGYLGRVTLNFDAAGNLTGIDNSSGPQRVASTTADPTHGVAPDTDVQNDAVAPVQTFIAGLAAQKLAETSVQLLQGGSSIIRSRETNLGSLVADGILSAAQDKADDFSVDTPVIALVNGGGIRASVAAGNVSRLDTFNVSPFGNFVAVVEDVKYSDLKLLLENAYSQIIDGNPAAGAQNVTPVASGSGTGRFAHLAGMEVVYDVSQSALTFDAAGNILTPGNRILDITIAGVPVLIDGVWQFDPNTTTVDMALLAFSAAGGDQWFRTASNGSDTYLSQLYSFTTLVGQTDQASLQEYIELIANGDDTFDLSTYLPEYAIQQSIQGGRITVVPEPASFALALLGAGSLLTARRRRA